MMNKLFRVFLPLLAVLHLTACGGGGGSSPGTPAAAAPANEFVKTYAPGGPGDSDTNIVTNISSNPPYEQSLYLAGDALENASGYITGIRYTLNADVTQAVTCPGTKIWMRHTNLTDLGSTFNDNFAVNTGQGSNVKVFSGPFTVPAQSAGATFEIKFDTPFLYNGVDNLFVEVERGSTCTDQVKLKRRISSGYMSSYNFGDSGPVAALDYAQFVFSAGEDTLTYPVSSGYSTGAPFTYDTNYQHVQILHHASDIAGKGKITGIALKLGGSGTTSLLSYHVTVKIGTTSNTSLNDTYANNFDSGAPVTVADNALFVVPANEPAGQTIWLPIQNDYDYNGKDNLVIDITATPDNTASMSMSVPWALSDNGSYAQILSAAAGVTVGNLDFRVPLTTLRFKGAPVQVMPVKTSDSSVPIAYDTSNLTTGILYEMSSIGGAGQISGIACRLDNGTAVAGDYPMKIQIITPGTGTIPLSIPTTVFDGVVTIPNTIAQGDWVEFPFTTPFNSNGINWLSVSFQSGIGPANLLCDAGADNALYTNYTSINVNNTGVTQENKLASMRFYFN